MVDVEQFASLANAEVAYGLGQAYIALSYQIYSESHKAAGDEAVCCGTVQLDGPGLPEQLECVAEVFSEELLDSLNTHDQVKHPINLLPGKLPKGGTIYNMSHDELAAIRDYLHSALEKKWI